MDALENSPIYKCCMSKKNIIQILDGVCYHINLNENSVKKCVIMIKNNLLNNIQRITRHPRNQNELIALIDRLNKLCINSIIEYITKKYPDKFINRKKQASKEYLNRELETIGKKGPHPNLMNRPHSQAQYKTKSRTVEDDRIKSSPSYADDLNGLNESGNYSDFDTESENMAYRGSNPHIGGTGNYASAFGDHSITNIPRLDSNNQPFETRSNTDYHGRHTHVVANQQQSDMMSRIREQRDRDIARPQKPPTPNWSLDKTDEEFQRERAEIHTKRQSDMTQMPNQVPQFGFNQGQNQNQNQYQQEDQNQFQFQPQNQVQHMSMASFTDNSNPNDAFYSSLLGQGAPNSEQFGFGFDSGSNSNSNSGFNQMPMSNTSMDYSNSGQNNFRKPNAKEEQLKSDYERMMAERNSIDHDTDQRIIPRADQPQFQFQMPQYQPQQNYR